MRSTPPPPAEYKDLTAVDKLDLFLLPTIFLFLSEVTTNPSSGHISSSSIEAMPEAVGYIGRSAGA
jgi:hypothetical protein